MKIEAGKYYKTRGGSRAFIGAKKPEGFNGDYDFFGVVEEARSEKWISGSCWKANGRTVLANDDHDIVGEWKETKRIKGWVSLKANPDHEGDYDAATLFTDKNRALEYCGNGRLLVEVDAVAEEVVK